MTINKDSDREPDFRIMDLDADGFLNVVGLAFWSLVNDSLKIVSKITPILFRSIILLYNLKESIHLKTCNVCMQALFTPSKFHFT